MDEPSNWVEGFDEYDQYFDEGALGEEVTKYTNGLKTDFIAKGGFGEVWRVRTDCSNGH